jgi:hypothetical protein
LSGAPDLNLMLVFEVIFGHESVTRTAGQGVKAARVFLNNFINKIAICPNSAFSRRPG